jgi:hypothetical protein
MSASETTTGFRALGDASRLPEDYVNAYYFEDLKRRPTKDLGVYEVNDTMARSTSASESARRSG